MTKLHPAIRVQVEQERGCGWRDTPGAMYLVLDGPVGGCDKLPVSLDRLNRCPYCGEQLPPDYAIRWSRAPRMLHTPELLWQDIPCTRADCHTCPLSNAYETGPALLLWVGRSHYGTPQQFMEEAIRMGLSRRIPQIPLDFVIGETWVLLAHEKAITKAEEVWEEDDGQARLFPKVETTHEPGIFGIFRPTRIEVIVTGEEPDEVIDAYVKRGLTPVLVKRAEAQEQRG